MDVFSFQSQSAKERLYHDPSQTIIHVPLKAGREVPEHSGEKAVVTVIPIKGKVIFSVKEQPEVLIPGKIARFDSSEKHAIKALEDSDLVIVKWRLPDSQNKN
ncbi:MULTISPECIES: hypothetical protein [unclassified Sporolactobacillus]|uniref:hypothetical protein n=1 Tax=unclassified Sporolactobacillus TaxID=2628533 RepID=UPI002367A91A|nr:hypothetical protein [Sporolactobacillus sp. CQH2019]MDD9147530.1 hypothetical protein [Sporolactobacillus sp. CQH2019]